VKFSVEKARVPRRGHKPACCGKQKLLHDLAEFGTRTALGIASLQQSSPSELALAHAAIPASIAAKLRSVHEPRYSGLNNSSYPGQLSIAPATLNEQAIGICIWPRGPSMLWTIFAILLILWLLGWGFHIAGSLIHILLVVALVVAVLNLISGRRAL
jgi:hypothetical protein